MNLLDPLSWAILLMLFGGLLAVSEIFIPSGGILGLLSSVAITSKRPASPMPMLFSQGSLTVCKMTMSPFALT